MQITREELNPCTIQLAVVCDPTEVQDGFDKAVRNLGKKIKVAGFRPGHAPKHLLESMLNPEDIREAAADQIVRDLYPKAVKAENLVPEPSVQPYVDLKSIDRDPAACEFVMKVSLPPRVDLGDVRKLSVDAEPIEVTDDEIDSAIDRLRAQRSSRESVTDRGVEEGDYVVANIVEVGGKEEGRNFMVVAGKSFATLDDTLLGMRVEDMKNVKLDVPAEFSDKDWAGRSFEAQVTVNSITATRMPALDETFAEQLKHESVEKLREAMREAILVAKTDASREMMTERLLDALLEKSTVLVPDRMWESLAERRIMETVEEQGKQGKSLEDYAKENGMTLEQLIESWRQKAKLHVLRALLIREIFAKEKMALVPTDLNVELQKMALEYEIGPAELLNLLKKNRQIDELHFRAISRKVSDFLIDVAGKKPEPAGKA